MGKNYYLVTTALEDFWDTSKSILFLGKWCQKYDRRFHWGSLEANELQGPFLNSVDSHEAYVYVDEVYERALALLANELNIIHGKSYSDRYWRIVIGPWLRTYLPVIYDRYMHLVKALEEFPTLTTTVLCKDSYVLSSDTLEFTCGVSEDAFNLQIFSKILYVLGKDFPSKRCKIETNPLYDRMSKTSWKNRLVVKCTKLYGRAVFGRFSAAVVFKDSYFSRLDEMKIFRRLFGRLLPIRGGGGFRLTHQYDSEMRQGINSLSIGDDLFSECVSKLISSDMPICFLEGYKSICENGKSTFPNSPKAIFSANAWYYDEGFKIWAAGCGESGTVLLGTPHGGNYGAVRDMHAVKHESEIVDYYYSWGWKREGCNATVIPMPAPKLMGITKIGADNSKRDILWVTTAASRYLDQSFVLPIFFERYLEWHKRFVDSISDVLLPQLLIRTHYQDLCWGLVPRIKEVVPELRVDSWDAPFVRRLEGCRLYVCDHLSTTFTEALAANKPTILFWDPEDNELRTDAKPYFDLLRSNGILFDTPEAAAEAVNCVYDDVESWWDDPVRQEAVSVFCEQFARTSPDALNLWTEEFHRIISNNE